MQFIEHGSVRGASGNGRPYRERDSKESTVSCKADTGGTLRNKHEDEEGTGREDYRRGATVWIQSARNRLSFRTTLHNNQQDHT
jgi:hypothetical protein